MPINKYHALRVQAEHFNDNNLLGVIDGDYELYSYLACQRFGVPYQLLETTDARRVYIKRLLFGLTYHATLEHLAAVTGAPLSTVLTDIGWLKESYPSFFEVYQGTAETPAERTAHLRSVLAVHNAWNYESAQNDEIHGSAICARINDETTLVSLPKLPPSWEGAVVDVTLRRQVWPIKLPGE